MSHGVRFVISMACACALAATAACHDKAAGAQAQASPPPVATPAVSASAAPSTLAPSLAPMLARVAAGVVNISVEGVVKVQNPLFQDPLFRQFFNVPDQPQSENERFQAVGSGIIVDAKRGYVLTNDHVVTNANSILVTLKDRRQFKATLVGTDPQTDIAVLKIQPDNLTAVPLGDSSKLQVGDYVVAIGDPFGVGQTATFGIVSALERNGLGIEGYEDFIQTDASINPGNSGGALVNVDGQLIGISTAILSRSGGNVGIGFAIPIDMAQQVAGQLEAHGKIERGQLGIEIQDLTPNLAHAMGVTATGGAVVAQVQAGSPAESAGIKQGDVITELNGKQLNDSAELRNGVGLMAPGTTVTLGLIRNGQHMDVKAKLEPAKQEAQSSETPSAQSPLAGAQLGAIPDDNAAHGQVTGVYVASVDPGSDAAEAGLQAGDIITSVDREAVSSPDDISRIAGQHKDKPLLLQVHRDNAELFIAIG